MAPKKSPSLDLVVPTKAELDAAKKLLLASNDKQKKSKMQSMVHYLKANPDDAAAISRGDARQQYLVTFLVHQMRTKGTTKTASNERVLSSSDSSMSDLHWLAAEKMDDAVGKKKGEAWRKSGKLRSRPDPVTGSTDEDMIEYAVPLEWTRAKNEDMSAFGVKTDGDADEGDLELLGDIGDPGGARVPVKVEKQTAEELMTVKVEDLKGNVQNQVRRYQEFVLECKILAAEADKIKYADGLVSDNQKHLAKLQKVLKFSENMAIGKPVIDSELPKLVENMETMSKEHAELEGWASRFGCTFGSKGSKRRKK